MSTIIHTGTIRSGTGFEVASQPRTKTSVSAKVAADQIHKGKPAVAVSSSTGKTQAKVAVQEQPAAPRQAPHPMTSYNAQGHVRAAEAAQTGNRFHGSA